MRSVKPSLVYLITDGDQNYKIGVTIDLQGRLRQLQTGNHRKLKIVASFEGTEADEKRYHEKFEFNRVSGEWFSFDKHHCIELEQEFQCLQKDKYLWKHTDVIPWSLQGNLLSCHQMNYEAYANVAAEFFSGEDLGRLCSDSVFWISAASLSPEHFRQILALCVAGPSAEVDRG